MEAIQENKVLLKTMYMKAKALGEHVNRAHEVNILISYFFVLTEIRT
jgi:hypothetical protein